MAMNQEARALVRDARCAVREYGVGDNASRVRQKYEQKIVRSGGFWTVAVEG